MCLIFRVSQRQNVFVHSVGDFKEVKYEDWADDCSNTGLEGQR